MYLGQEILTQVQCLRGFRILWYFFENSGISTAEVVGLVLQILFS